MLEETKAKLEEAGINPKYAWAVVSLLILFVGFLIFDSGSDRTPSTNVLALANRTTVKGEMQIPIYEPVPLSGLSRSAIFEIREKYVNQNRELLSGDYNPTGAVFAGVKSGNPWFSLYGFFYKGRSLESMEGPSAEARNIVNPFVLVSPEFWSLTKWTPDGMIWDESKVDHQKFRNIGSGIYPMPRSLVWSPEKSEGRVTYELSQYIDKLNSYSAKELPKGNISFGLTAYNAVDFGYKYMSVDSKYSEGISGFDGSAEAVEITDAINSMANFCSDGSECNHMDVPMPEFDQLSIGSLPARLYIKLWHAKPENAEQPANTAFIINFN